MSCSLCIRAFALIVINTLTAALSGILTISVTSLERFCCSFLSSARCLLSAFLAKNS